MSENYLILTYQLPSITIQNYSVIFELCTLLTKWWPMHPCQLKQAAFPWILIRTPMSIIVPSASIGPYLHRATTCSGSFLCYSSRDHRGKDTDSCVSVLLFSNDPCLFKEKYIRPCVPIPSLKMTNQNTFKGPKPPHSEKS